jgi:two-component system, NarL family, sensor histidine kinase DegS
MLKEETALSGADLLAVLIQESQKEYDQIQKELKEIDVLIRQNSVEVERLAQRNVQVSNRMRQMEMQFDTFPRKDIKEVYSASHEAEMRLFMMRGQLEQLQNRQEVLERQSQRLRQVVELSSQIAPADVAERVSVAIPGSQRDMVRIIETQEKERQRLARQMHDGPAQSLTNLMLQAEICERLFDTDPIRARVELGNLKNAVSATFHKIRDFISTLRPMMLDDLGLLPTLKQYVQGLEEKARLSINFAVLGHESRLPSHVEVALFRMIQELLANVQAHAHATHVQVTVDFQDEAIVASIEDDGSGFDLNEMQNPAQLRKGLGLATIKERAEMLGGQVQFESRIGRGTRVRIEIPTSVA